MTRLGQTLFRFSGAVVLGAAATVLDQPALFRASKVPSSVTVVASDARRLTPADADQGAQIGITPGKRAMAFRINDVAGLAAIARPDNRVDVLVLVGSSGAPREARMFMENMRLLAIGTTPDRTADGRTVNAVIATIEVTPQEAERLAIAQSQGELQIRLRGSGDPGNARSPAALSRDSLLRRRP
jgi:pilus assembly protein CpaB